MEKNEDIGLKLGSDEMVFWQGIIDARELDIKSSHDNIKYFEAILEIAKKKFAEAEKEFNKKENAH